MGGFEKVLLTLFLHLSAMDAGLQVPAQWPNKTMPSPKSLAQIPKRKICHYTQTKCLNSPIYYILRTNNTVLMIWQPLQLWHL